MIIQQQDDYAVDVHLSYLEPDLLHLCIRRLGGAQPSAPQDYFLSSAEIDCMIDYLNRTRCF